MVAIESLWDDPKPPKSLAILRGQRLHFANWNSILNMGQRSKSPLKNDYFPGKSAFLMAFLMEHQHFRIIVAIFFGSISDAQPSGPCWFLKVLRARACRSMLSPGHRTADDRKGPHRPTNICLGAPSWGSFMQGIDSNVGIYHRDIDIGNSPKSFILDWDFPWNKPSSYWGTPIYWNSCFSHLPCKWVAISRCKWRWFM